MAVRRLGVRPTLDQLESEADGLLRAVRSADATALAEWARWEGPHADVGSVTIADARRVVARSHDAPDWERLVQAVALVDAIWSDDADAVRNLVAQHGNLLHEPVLIRRDSNWGPPMSYAANLGRDGIIRLLHGLGARDHEHAAGRAALQGRPDTVRLIYDLAGRPPIGVGSLAGPAYTLSVEGTAVLFALGASVMGPDGIDRNTMEHLLGTDSRNPAAKHRILEMYEEHGFEPPDTPVMALHRGRIDLLEAHLARDRALLTRTFDVREVYPLAPACAVDPHVAPGTPVHGGTLLHIAVFFDEVEIAEWLLQRGMDVNARSALDADGFGGFTALHASVVSQRNFWVNHGAGQPDEARMTRLLLAHGADPSVRASIRSRLHEGHGGGPLREYRQVTSLEWGEQYAAPIFVSRAALQLLKTNQAA